MKNKKGYTLKMPSEIRTKKQWQVSEYICENCGRFFWMPTFLDYLHCPYCESYYRAWNNDDTIIIRWQKRKYKWNQKVHKARAKDLRNLWPNR